MNARSRWRTERPDDDDDDDDESVRREVARGENDGVRQRLNVREVTTMLRRQTSKVDGSVFERVPDGVGRLRSARCGPR